jgi:hypothetical protein
MLSIKVKAIRLFSFNLSIFLHNIHFIVLSNNLFILFLSEIAPWWGNGKRASLECGRPWVWFWFIVLNATIFQLVVAVSFIGEEIPKDPGKHPICRKSVSHNVIHLALIGSRSNNISDDRYRLDLVVVNSTTMRSRSRRPF